MKKILLIVAIAIGLVLVGVGIGALVIRHRCDVLLTTKLDVAVKAPAIAGDAAQLARGAHLVTAVLACRECHGANFAGKAVIDEQPVGRVTAPNITRGEGGVVTAYTSQDWARAVRHGVRRDGLPILLMPSLSYAALTDEDLAAAIAYLDALPAAAGAPAPTALGPIGTMLVATGGFHLAAHSLDHAAVEAGGMSDVRSNTQLYLATVAGCSDCHVADAKGREIKPGVVAPSRSDARMQRYDRAAFERAVRSGTTLDGRTLNPLMPYGTYSGMDDAELDTLYGWLKS